MAHTPRPLDGLQPEADGSSKSDDRDPFDLAVRFELSRVLASPQFKNSKRLQEFLSFIVESTLKGDTGQLKESLIGVHVFERQVGFDPKQEPVVRVTARRLRDKLAEFYASEGGKSEVLIQLEKGTYIPTLLFRPSGEAVAGEKVRPPETEYIPIVLLSVPAVETNPVEANVTQAQAAAETKSNQSSPRRTHAGRLTLIMVGMAAVLTAGLFAVGRLPSWKERDGPADAVPLTSLPGDEMQPSFSPDGHKFVFRWRSPDFVHSALMEKASGQAGFQTLTDGNRTDYAPAWSPDGTMIAFIRDDRDVMLMPAGGGPVRKVTETNGDHLSWVAGTNRLIFAARNPSTRQFWMDTIDVKSGEHRLLLDSDANVNAYMPVLFSADGKQFLYAATTNDGANELMIQFSGSGRRERILHTKSAIRGFAWSVDDQSVVFSANTSGTFRLWRVNRHSMEVNPLPMAGQDSYFPVLSRVSEARGSRGSSDRGSLAFEKRELSTHLYDVPLSGPAGDPRGTRPASLLSLASTRVDSSPALSPDGRELCFVSDRAGKMQLWRAKLGSKDAPSSLSTGEGEPGSPKWHPSRQLIVFDVLRGPDRNIWVYDFQTGKLSQITFWPGNQLRPSWSRDGKWIYFGSSHSGAQQIWKVRYDPEAKNRLAPVEVTTHGGFEAVESAEDGRLFYTEGDATGSLWFISTSGGAEERLFAGPVRSGWWSPGAHGIYFVKFGPNLPNTAMAHGESINYFDFRTRTVRQLAAIHQSVFVQRPDFCVSRSEDRLLFGQIDFENIDLMVIDNFR